MLSEIRTIFFRTELEFVPLGGDDGFTRDTAQRLYVALAQGDGDFSFENVEMSTEPPRLTTKSGGHLIKCEIGKNSIAIEEKKAKSNVDDFASVVRAVMDGMELAEEEQLEQMFLAFQETTVRGLVQPHGCEDAIELLTIKLSQVQSKIDPFNRPPAFFGMRFTFPPYEPEEEGSNGSDDNAEQAGQAESTAEGEPINGIAEDTDENSLPEELLHVTYQTWTDDVKQVLIEVTARRLLFGMELLEEGSPGIIIENMRRAHSFLKKNAVEFLDAFDSTEE